MSASENLGPQWDMQYHDMSPFRPAHPYDRHGRPLGEPDKVRAFKPGTSDQVGFMTMKHDGSAVDEAWVHPDHRRQGLATAMYEHLNQRAGRKLALGTDRSDAGDAWAQKQGAPPRTYHQKWDGIGGMYAP